MAVCATAVGLSLGFLVDRLLGDPQRGHPVAGFGRLAQRLQERCWADSRGNGLGYVAVLVGGVSAAAGVAEKAVARSPITRVALTAAVTWAVLGGRSLTQEAQTMRQLVADGQIVQARRRLSHLCSRDASTLDAEELVRATVESLAENTSDAVTGPLLWAAVAGLPGLVGYRAANTLDAMVGYRTARYERFGWAAARLDDLINLVPARVTAMITVLSAPVSGGSARTAWQVWQQDASKHPSPNAGPVEASTAGALGVSLGGANIYSGTLEDRGVLGSGPAPSVEDLERAIRLSRTVSWGCLIVAVTVAALNDRRRH